MKRLAALACIVALTGCAQDEVAPDEQENEDAVAQSPLNAIGGFLITLPDGSQQLNVAREDGSFYAVNEITGSGSWTSEDGTFCASPDAQWEEEGACYTFTDIGEDGTYVATGNANGEVTVLRIDQDNVGEGAPEHAVGAHLLTIGDGSQFVAISKPDGTYVEGPLAGTGTFGIEGEERCWSFAGEAEACVTVGEWEEDGSFTVYPTEGVSYTVQKIL